MLSSWKILSRRPVNKNALREVINELWKVEESLNIMEVGRDLWLFSFDSEGEHKQILDMQPWNFQG